MIPIKILRKWEETRCKSQLGLSELSKFRLSVLSEASLAGTVSTPLGCEVQLNLYTTLPYLVKKIGTTCLSDGS